MRLKLLLFLLLLVMHSSFSKKVTNSIKLNGKSFEMTSSNSSRNGFSENKEIEEKENLQGSTLGRFRKDFSSFLPAEKNVTRENCSICQCQNKKQGLKSINSTIQNFKNQQNMSSLLIKKLISDRRYKEILNSERDLNILSTWLMNRKQLLVEKPEKPDRKRKKRKRSKLCTVSVNELGKKNQLQENAISRLRTKQNLKWSNEGDTIVGKRVKRQLQKLWIRRDFIGLDDVLSMHAFIIRDEDIPQCPNTASKITNTRYFMCTGVILTKRHILTTASCIHFAHIYEHHIEAELAVLIGAVSNATYVMKVIKYEMHPKYIYNLEAMENVEHNVAILTIGCGIPQESLFYPKWPTDFYHDVSHFCCSKFCALLTVHQTPGNRHRIQLMKAKYVPETKHNKFKSAEERFFDRFQREAPKLVEKVKRDIKRLAPPPLFFNGESQLPEKNPLSRRQFNESVINSTTEEPNDAVSSIYKDLIEQITNLDWTKIQNSASPQNLSPINKQAIQNFTKEIVEAAIQQMQTLVADEKSSNVQKSSFGNQASSILGQNLSQTDLKNLFANAILSATYSKLNLSQNSTIEIIGSALPDPDDKYYNCPPLGTPVIVNQTLVGLVAYTCDDMQSWVPWKYVDITMNMEWIFQKIYMKKNAGETMSPHNNDNKYKSVKKNNKMPNKLQETKERVLKSRKSSDDFIDSMNPRFSNEKSPTKTLPHVQKIIQNYENQERLEDQGSLMNSNFVNKIDFENSYDAVNNCYLNEDGIVICQSQTHTEKLN